MKKDVLRTIKNDMWDVRANKKYCQAEIKLRLREVEQRRKDALAEYEALPEDDFFRSYAFRTTNERFDRERIDVVKEVFDRYDNYQSYYLIYNDGSSVVITAEEILGGEPFPKMSGIVYAQMVSADDYMDTESGDLDFYTDESLQKCGYDYSVEDERKYQYELAIEFKFGTQWSKELHASHPEFVPMAI